MKRRNSIIIFISERTGIKVIRSFFDNILIIERLHFVITYFSGKNEKIWSRNRYNIVSGLKYRMFIRLDFRTDNELGGSRSYIRGRQGQAPRHIKTVTGRNGVNHLGIIFIEIPRFSTAADKKRTLRQINHSEKKRTEIRCKIIRRKGFYIIRT